MAQQVVTEEQKLVVTVPGQAEAVSEVRQQAEQILLVLERAVLEQCVPEQAVLEQTVPERVAPERVAPEQVVLEQVVPEQAVLERAVLERDEPKQRLLLQCELERVAP